MRRSVRRQCDVDIEAFRHLACIRKRQGPYIDTNSITEPSFLNTNGFVPHNRISTWVSIYTYNRSSVV